MGRGWKRAEQTQVPRQSLTRQTLYWRIKNLLKIERFHARSFNGVMHEIFANLLVLSLTALVWAATIKKRHLNDSKVLPNKGITRQSLLKTWIVDKLDILDGKKVV